MQQLVELIHVCHIRRRTQMAMDLTRSVMDADGRWHAEEILASFLRLMHFGIAFSVLVLARARNKARSIDQSLPDYDLIHLDQETLFTALLAFAGLLGVGKGDLLHQASRRLISDIKPSFDVFFRVFLNLKGVRCIRSNVDQCQLLC